MGREFIGRAIATTIEEAYRYFSVITMSGPRQSGKSTLIRHLFPDLPYYSFEDLDLRALAMSDPRAFLNAHPEGMIIDEAQHVPELLSYIQGIVDNDDSKRYIVSGSAQFSVLKKITQSLAGRTAVLDLLPMSYYEVEDKAKEKPIDNLLYDGFYPAIYNGSKIPRLFYPSYVKTYLERDLRDLSEIKDLMLFQTFMKLCAGRIGSLFNASELSNEVGVSSNTIKSWVSILQASYIIKLLPPFFENRGKRLTKSPKLYFCDTGLACSLLDIETPAQLARDKMRGLLFENFIINEAIKYRTNQGKESNLYFYRDSNGVEVDLLIKSGDSYKAIEIKSAQTYNPTFERGLKLLQGYLGEKLTDKAIVYAGELESNVKDIKLLNYKHLNTMF